MLGFVVYIKTHYSQPPRERVGLLSVDLNRKLKFKACFGLKDVTACWCGVGLSLQSSTLNKKQDMLGQNIISLRNMLMKFIENDSFVILLFDNKTFKL